MQTKLILLIILITSNLGLFAADYRSSDQEISDAIADLKIKSQAQQDNINIIVRIDRQNVPWKKAADTLEQLHKKKHICGYTHTGKVVNIKIDNMKNSVLILEYHFITMDGGFSLSPPKKCTIS